MVPEKFKKIRPDDERLQSPSLGHNFDVVCFDEATDFTKDHIKSLTGGSVAQKLSEIEDWINGIVRDEILKITPDMLADAADKIDPHPKEGPRVLRYEGQTFTGATEAECLRKVEEWAIKHRGRGLPDETLTCGPHKSTLCGKI